MHDRFLAILFREKMTNVPLFVPLIVAVAYLSFFLSIPQ